MKKKKKREDNPVRATGATPILAWLLKLFGYEPTRRY